MIELSSSILAAIIVILYIVMSILLFHQCEIILEKKKSIVLYIISIVINFIITYAGIKFLVQGIFVTIPLLILFCIELKFIFKTDIRKSIFLSTLIFISPVTSYLVTYAGYGFVLGLSPAYIRDNVILKQIVYITIIISMIFLLSITIRHLAIEDIRKVMKQDKFSGMISLIAAVVVLYTMIDSFILAEEKITFVSLNIAISSLLLNIFMMYKLVDFIIKFVDINIYREQTTKLKLQYEHVVKQEVELFKKINCDSLTKLYNRNVVYHRMKELCDNYREPFAVFFADINGLKKVNDTLGHNVGDEYIVNVANVLQSKLCTGDYIARIGGDEILFIKENFDNKEAEIVLQRINDGMEQLQNKESRYKPSISIGYVIVTEQLAKTTIKNIIKIADSNMYEAKKKFYDNKGGK